MSSHWITRESLKHGGLDCLLDELDLNAGRYSKQAKEDPDWVSRRRHQRYPFRVGCTVRFVAPRGDCIASIPGRTRNLSRSGLGLLVRRLFTLDEPIEVDFSPSVCPHRVMAGLVRFCRYAGEGEYEVGLEFKAIASKPIFQDDPSMVKRQASKWLRSGDCSIITE